MARAKKKTETLILTEEELQQIQAARANPPELEDRELDQDDVRALTELDSAGEVTWRVTCVEPHDKKGHVVDMSSAELSVERIAQLYGPGKFRIRGTTSGGQFFKHGTVQVSVLAARNAGPGAPSAGAMPGSTQSGVADVLAIIRAEKERDKNNLLEWGKLIVPPLIPVLAGLFNRSEKPTTLADLTTALANMKQLAGTDQTQLSRVEELRSLVEVVREIGGDTKQVGKTGWDVASDIASAIAPALPGLIASARAAPAPSPAPQQFLPAADRQPIPPQPNGAAAQPAPEHPMLGLINLLRGQLPGLVNCAAQDKDPELYAAVLFDNLPPNADLLQVRGFLNQENWWEMFKSFYPPVTPYGGWFNAMRESLLEAINTALVEQAQPLPDQMASEGESSE